MIADLVSGLIVSIFSGVALGIAAMIRVYYTKIRPMIKRRIARKDIARNAVLFNRMQVAMSSWRSVYQAMRVLCLTARNGGSTWDAHKVLYMSVIGEVHRDDVPRVFERWQSWTCDPPYRQLLSDVIMAGDRGFLVVTENMASGVFRDFYLDQGVVATILFPIHITSQAELIYVSISFGDPQNKENHEEIRKHAQTLFDSPERIRSMVTTAKSIWSNV